MALINCIECGKEVSDKAVSCPNCGYPIKDTVSVSKQDSEVLSTENENIETIKSNNYKKFDFEYIKRTSREPEINRNYQNQKHKKFKEYSIIALVVAIISLFLTISGGGIFWIIITLIAGYIAYSYNSTANDNNFDYDEVEEYIRDNYYNSKVNILSMIPQDLQYEAIDLITANSKVELLKKAYKLQADALIDTKMGEYTSSHVKSTAIHKTIKTDVSHHESWSATAVKIITPNVHEAINKQILNVEFPIHIKSIREGMKDI